MPETSAQATAEFILLLEELATVPIASDSPRIQAALEEMRRLLSHGDEGLAFQALCSSFRRPEFPLSRPHYRSMQLLGLYYGLPISLWASCYTADYFITRAFKWGDPQGPDITPKEWQSVVAAEPDLVQLSEDCIRAKWTQAEDEPGILEWCSGGIVARTSTDAFLTKLQHIASKLNAKVFDADGGFYPMYDR